MTAAANPLLGLDALATGDDGMIADEQKIDWSAKPHSQRTDRPLTDEEMMRLSEKSDFVGFLYFFGNAALLALNAVIIAHLIEGPRAMYPLLGMLVVWHGFSICAMGFAGQHECCHFTAFKSIRLNKAFLFVLSLPAFSFGEHEMLLHRDHHTFLGDPRRDTELVDWGDMVYKNGFRKVPESISEYWWLFISLTWNTALNRARKLGYCAMGRPVCYTCIDWRVARDVNSGTPSIKERLQWWARAHLTFYAITLPLCFYFIGAKLLFWCWFLPWFVGPAPLWFIQIAEHADCTRDDNGLTNTRSVDMNPLVRFVYWNMNYHAEHHLYSTFPFHQLPAAHRLLKGKLLKSDDNFFNLHYKVVTQYIPKQIAEEPVSADRT
eukprot:TRINITY_DN91904_c0_g1_i1.p1 TRINITY_DN91904_c0_g1~~TRINITY_DN91904_c0_g1_i1.p1  ORF type:complete len:404 (+),score=72.59 TRINITY_DN91904_c0_g1_i1:79-1212(+)